MAKRTINTCGHPELPCAAYGMCSKCYYQANKQKWVDRKPKNLAEDRREAAIRARRSTMFKFRYGIDIVAYEAMVAAQENLCAICGRAPDPKDRHKVLHVDHDHATGKIRELLCNRCNLSLGGFEDRIDWLEAAITYVKRHQSAGGAADGN